MSNGGRRAELDGVRGIAILLVLVGHMFDALAPLAAAGVTLFFALSGYLISGLLLAEHERSGRFSLRRFYARRFTRLAPPLLVMLGVMGVLLGSSWQQLLAPATWLSNYAKVAGADIAPFDHTWSLAVEEQFYLLYPIALLLLLRLRRPAVVLGGITAGLILWRVVLLVSGYPSYAYYALETAGVPILGGCLVALSHERLPKGRAVTSMTLLLGTALALSAVNPDLWSIAPLAVMPMTRDLLASARGVSWLSWRPLVFCGVASYSLYLWHVPVAVLVDGQLAPVGVAVGAGVGLAAFLIVEIPVMRWRERRGASARGSDRRLVSASAVERNGG